MNEFTKLDNSQESEIIGGSVVSAIISLIPVAIEAAVGIASIVKMFTGQSGKTKLGKTTVEYNDGIKSNNAKHAIYIAY
ncbi:hypothetical protein [Mycoplasma sp. Mirounga ES2805-ORL]|uniref:hypothetical protein n=1 Tax=Mycoplasma sp. Mirounga ES2805-ORL TaxID=754514 RepID=UPI00197C5DA8|nr:hypothetical protein [Mycoplasma sp. Mirounga ES2805-ORL]QSF13979.1 hypothetical protein JXZ90_01675 [Mycoplasma sp. Mirounga ES2805-ORL]